MTALHVSPERFLPLDLVTKTTAILAQRRKGKSYTASVLAEELVEAKIPFVALDPTGAWWGLRSSADGRAPGLPVVILGGQHGDLPLERTAGRFVADLVVDEPGWYVIDFSLFESGGAERQFATDFAERLYRRKGQAGSDFPLHLFVDEADRFVPQRVRGGRGDARETDERLLGAFEAIVRRGGLRGLGTTLISQRAAVVNKNVLEQIDVLIVLRVVGPNDRRAIEDYLKADADDDQRRILMGSLASLELGEAWLWEPGGDPPLFDRVHIRERHTFNSSATPKPGQVRVEPRSFAEVDLASIKEQMAETIERVKADDPGELRRRIKQLEQQLATRQAPPPVEEKVVEVPVLDEELVGQLKDSLTGVSTLVERFQSAAESISSQLHVARTAERTPRRTEQAPKSPPPRSERVERGVFGRKLTKAERSVLTVLAQYPDGRTQTQVALLAGYSSEGGGFQNALSSLRTAGLMERGQPLRATQAGVDALEGKWEPLPRGGALIDYWLGRLPKASRLALEVLVEEWPRKMTAAEVAERTGYEAGGGGFQNGLSRLRTLELIQGRGEMSPHEQLMED